VDLCLPATRDVKARQAPDFCERSEQNGACKWVESEPSNRGRPVMVSIVAARAGKFGFFHGERASADKLGRILSGLRI